jgi:hypothetical protein
LCLYDFTCPDGRCQESHHYWIWLAEGVGFEPTLV